MKDYSIITLDPSGKVATWNAGAEHQRGYKAEEILGKHFSMFYSPAERAAGLPAGRTAYRGKLRRKPA